MNTVLRTFLFLLFSQTVLPGGGLSEEVYTSFKAGAGYTIEDKTFFLLSYRLYRAPRGWRRFPDGGQSLTVFEATFLLSLEDNQLQWEKTLGNMALKDSELTLWSRRIFGEAAEAEKQYSRNFISSLIRSSGAGEIGLPTPLEYCRKSRREYLKDIIRLEGDFPYRQEIIRLMVAPGEEAREVLEKMAEYEEALNGSEQWEYRIFSEDTKMLLRKKSPRDS